MDAAKEIAGKLDKIAEYREVEERIHKEYDEKKSKILVKLQPKLLRLEEEYTKVFKTQRDAVQLLEDEVRADVLSLGESVKGAALHAVFMKGRVTWDSKGLAGYAIANPQVLAFKKEGEPSVSIRGIEQKSAG